MLKKKKSYLVPFIGFTIMIIVGAIFLCLPISNNKQIYEKLVLNQEITKREYFQLLDYFPYLLFHKIHYH